VLGGSGKLGVRPGYICSTFDAQADCLTDYAGENDLSGWGLIKSNGQPQFDFKPSTSC
jgi:hypothetical protein